MIIDSLKNSAKIECLHPRFKQLFDYVKSHDLTDVVPGRIEIDGDNLWLSISEVQGKQRTEALLETHNEYIDIQIPLREEETFGWMHKGALTEPKGSYSPENDICFYTDQPKLHFTLSPGEFVIFFPEDAHAPCIGERIIKKIVAKIKA